MITAYTLSVGLEEFEKTLKEGFSSKEWRDSRNQWMREQGIGGIIKDGKRSKSIPPWWGSISEFWFIDDESEKEFLRRYK